MEPASLGPKERQEALRDIQDVMSRYVAQLLRGCGQASCIEAACMTGRSNTSERPIRPFTARSARAAALTLASGPSPRQRLCKHYVANASAQPDQAADAPVDPSAFVQLLSDTDAIKSLCDPSRPLASALAENPIYLDKDVVMWTEVLESSEQQCPNDADPRDFRHAACVEVARSLQGLLCTFPAATPSQWSFVNSVIENGSVVPTNPKLAPDGSPLPDAWVGIVNRLQDPPANRLLCRILSTARRLEMHTINSLSHDAPAVNLSFSALLQLREAPSWIFSAFAIWLKYTFLCNWNSQCRLSKNSAAENALIFLSALHKTDFLCIQTPRLQWFTIPAVTKLIDQYEIIESWRKLDVGVLHQRATYNRALHVFDFPFLFALLEMTTHFRTLNFVLMKETHSKCLKASNLGIMEGNQALLMTSDARLEYLDKRFLLLNVSRGYALRDAFNQLWQRRPDELHRPLRVRLGELEEFEVGQDLGGVQIEFFNLVCREVLSEDAHMFTTNAKTGFTYFRSGSLQPLYMFELFGLCFGLALYNGITLPVNFPLAFYWRLLGHRASNLKLIEDGWPEEHRSLTSILNEDVADMGLNVVLPLEANGLRLQVLPPRHRGAQLQDGRATLSVVEATTINHTPPSTPKTPRAQQKCPAPPPFDPVSIPSIATAWPGWHLSASADPPTALTNTNKSTFVSDRVSWLAHDSTHPQWTAFLSGVHTLISPHTLQPCSPRHLQIIVEGTRDLDIPALRAATTYNGYDPDCAYIASFWRIVAAWPADKQHALVKFVTAAERIPAGGAGQVTFEVWKADKVSLEQLPTSSTCFGRLYLPQYESEEVLERKLGVAVEFGGEGFGTA